MPTIILTKDIEGRLCGLTEKDQAAYERFMRHAVGMPANEAITFSWLASRAPTYHKRHFVMLNAVFSQQETFTDSEVFRKWGEMEAGYCEQIPVPDGVMRVPKSISYEKLDQIEFEEIHAKVFSFLRSEYALLVMWPQLKWAQADAKMDSILREFEQPEAVRR